MAMTSARRIPRELGSKLDSVRRRKIVLGLTGAALAGLAFSIALLLAAMLADWGLGLFSHPARWALSTTTWVLALGATAGLLVLTARRRPRLSQVARDVDDTVPELEERWTTLAELSASRDPDAMRGADALVDQLSREAVTLEHLVQPREVVPPSAVAPRGWLLAACVAALLLA